MNKILKGLSSSSDITELVKYLEKTAPEIIKESVISKESENSFFLKFSRAIQDDYDKIKYLYDISKKYQYTLKNSLNNKEYEVNDLKVMLKGHSYNEQFLIECFNEFPKEEKIEIATDINLLMYAFEHNKITIIKELENYPELWQNEYKNNIIKENYLKNLELSELFYKNTNQNNVEEFRQQCKEFILKEIKLMEKSNIDYKLKNIVEYLADMSKKEEVFTHDFKEQLVGISLSAYNTKVTNGILKVLLKEKLSTYKPETPLWIHFENLKNKDILYQFLIGFDYQDKWIDKEGKSHYKIDYLEKALIKMDVYLSEKNDGRDNKTKRDVSISQNVFPLLRKYLNGSLEGKSGLARELLKESSKYANSIDINIPSNDKEIRIFLDNSLGYKENNELVILKKIRQNINKINQLKTIFEKDLFKNEEIICMVENFLSYDFSSDILELLKEKVIEKKLIVNIEKVLEKKNTLWGKNKSFLEELETILNYNTMDKKFGHVSENKIKKVKI